jgi:hypothetical protein
LISRIFSGVELTLPILTGSRTRETSQAGDKESRRDRSPVRAGSKELPRVQNLDLSAETKNGDDAVAKGSEAPVEVAAASAAKLTNGATTTEAGHEEEGKGDLEEMNGAVAAEETTTTGGEGRLAT